MMRTGFVGQAGTGAEAATVALLLCAKAVGKIEAAEKAVRVDSIRRRFVIIFRFLECKFCYIFNSYLGNKYNGYMPICHLKIQNY